MEGKCPICKSRQGRSNSSRTRRPSQMYSLTQLLAAQSRNRRKVLDDDVKLVHEYSATASGSVLLCFARRLVNAALASAMSAVMGCSVVVLVLGVNGSQSDASQGVWAVVRSAVLRSLLDEKRPASMNSKNTPVINVHPRRWSVDASEPPHPGRRSEKPRDVTQM